ncbi:OsmC family protein [Rhodococcus sp. ARC_M6]|nr:OsmC family protein [Rhodococcus sp. ARC_M6]MCJ0906808.1 OsmC family protein [Rhodococcus sp. ARC_M6]
MTTASISHLSSVVAANADAIGKNESKAHVVFKAAAQAHDAVASTVTLGKYSVEVDEPPALGGENKAANPVEYYLASLLSCQVVTYRVWADKLGIKLDDISARAEGDLDVRGFFGFDDAVRPGVSDAVRPGFSEVRVVVTLTGPESRGRYLELQEAVDAHCPVLDLTRNPVPVHTVVETA